MRLTLTLLGLELDIAFGPASSDDEVPEFAPYQDAGSTVSTPVGFGVAVVPWDADGPVHAFDPGEGDEDRR